MPSSNSLLQPSGLKNQALPFDQIRAEHFLPALRKAISIGKERLDQLTKAEPVNYDNTIRALEACTEDMEFVYLVYNNLALAESNEKLQELSSQMGPLVASFANDILLNPEVFRRIQQVYETRHNAKLTPEQSFLVEKVFHDFERGGAALPEAKKTRLRAIDERLAQLAPQFRENLLKAGNAFQLWITDEKDLEGLPLSQIMAAREAASAAGEPQKWLFTLHQPSYLPFMTFSQNRDLRENVYRAYNARAFGGAFDNQKVLVEIVHLMQEKAQLLGSPSHAHHALKQRMAETPEHVAQFLEKLLVAARPAAEKELREIEQLAKEMGGPSALEAWDFNYYAERLKEKKYAFDEEQLRPYFELNQVLNGAFQLAGQLFDLHFEENRDYPVYHSDVRVFEVYQNRGERRYIGLFYTDFYPRPGKSPGAWMTNFLEQGQFRGRAVRPHISIVCNFTKPTAEQPALLTFREVRTLFHEFGHALHGLLSSVEHRSVSGTNVYLDFVELPSQIYENWTQEEDSLKLFARHYKTGEVLPMPLIEKLKASQRFLAGYMALRQLNFALLDMAWFTNPPVHQAGFDVDTFEKQATLRTQLLKPAPGTNISSSFAHIFGGGYASGYYSYKWAEALDADAFELFKEKGIFDRETARRFEDFILSRGGSDHPMRLYERFRGRSPDPEALLRRDGLIN